MIDEINSQESIQDLDRLENFYAQWQSPHKKIEDIWTNFRLLPLNPAYLIASHYRYDKLGWSLLTKWKIYSEFDKALLGEENPNKISSAIASALETQRKIIALQNIFIALDDRTKTLQDKARIYNDLKKENPQLYQDIQHKIWIAKGKPKNEGEAKIEISLQPNELCHKIVIEKMLFLYNEGHPRLVDYFFEKLLKKK